MLGVKMYGGEWCQPGNIVMRQRGTEFHPGHGMGMVCQTAIAIPALSLAYYHVFVIMRLRAVACSKVVAGCAPAQAALCMHNARHRAPAVIRRAEITRCSPWSPAM